MNPELFKEIILLGKALEKVSNMEQDLKKLQDGIDHIIQLHKEHKAYNKADEIIKKLVQLLYITPPEEYNPEDDYDEYICTHVGVKGCEPAICTHSEPHLNDGDSCLISDDCDSVGRKVKCVKMNR